MCLLVGRKYAPANGRVINTTARSLQTRLGQGACRLTACVFNDVDDNDNLMTQYIFLPGGDCDPTDANGRTGRYPEALEGQRRHTGMYEPVLTVVRGMR